jgi:predicted trehalose synthase
MTDSKEAWTDAGSKLSDLGRKLRQHYDDEAGTPEAQTEVKDALARLGGAVKDVFDALGHAAKDPEVKSDVQQVGQSLTAALGVTFSEVSDDLRRAFGSPPPAEATPPAETAPPAETTQPTRPAAEPDAAQAKRRDGEGVEPWGTP